MNIKRFIALLLCLALMAGLLSGCGNKASEPAQAGAEANPNAQASAPAANDETAPVQSAEPQADDELVYQSVFSQTPEGLSPYVDLQLVNGALYAADYDVIGEREPTQEELENYPNEEWIYQEYGNILYRLDPDSLEVGRLEGFVPLSDSLEPPAGMEGSSYVNKFLAGPEGTLWILEDASYYNENSYEHTAYLRQLDDTGAEVQRLELAVLGENGEIDYVNDIAMDSQGLCYLTNGETICAVDQTGTVLFALTGDSWFDSLTVLPDDRVAVMSFDRMQGGQVLRVLDPQTRDWAQETIQLPTDSYTIYPGGGDYLLLAASSTKLYGLRTDTGEFEELLTWVDCDLTQSEVNSLAYLEGGHILLTTYDWTAEEAYLVNLNRVPASQVPQKTVLTVACLWRDEALNRAIVKFNRLSQTYRVVPVEYSDYDDPESQLKTDLMTGSAPDLIEMSQFDSGQYIQKGYLEDLLPRLDQDPDLGREDLLDCYLNANLQSGGLYLVYPTFRLYSIMGRSETVGDQPGWTWEQANALWQAHPEASFLGPYSTQDSVLGMFCIYNLDQFVDWTAGTCDFDNQAFVDLLEFAARFPAEMNQETDEWSSIYAGTQLVVQSSLSGWDELAQYYALFGGQVTLIGFPGSGEDVGSAIQPGSFALSLCSASANKDGAWEFLRFLLSADYQKTGRYWDGFATNRAAFEDSIQTYLSEITYDENGNPQSTGGVGWGDGIMLEIYPVGQEQIDQVTGLLDRITRSYSYDSQLLSIISEEAAAFFAGQRSAADTASIIQGRIRIYISEQS